MALGYLTVTGRLAGDVHVFDCRRFTDPARARRPNHVGTDEALLRGVVNHPRFPAWWEAQATRVADALFAHMAATTRLGGPPTFAFFCRKGRRRSVAVATRLTELLVDQGWSVEVCHLHQDFGRLGACNQCATCRDLRAAEKRALYPQVAGVLQAHQLPPNVMEYYG